MKKKRIMIIGAARSGKTSLANLLNAEERPLRRTHDTIYREKTLEVPSAYLENTWMYQHLIALAQDAWCILLLVDQAQPQELYSPGFASAFRLPVLGLITKADLAAENRACCRQQLAQIGVQPPYLAVSMKTGEGLPELQKILGAMEGGREQHEVHH